MWRQAIISVSLPLFLIILALEILLLGGMRLVFAGDDLDPFAPYEAIMPGQPTAALEQYPCQFESAYELETAATICRIRPADDIFSQVTVLFYDGKIWQVVFKSEGLRVGDLIQRWDRPRVIRNGRGDFYIQWGGTLYAVATPPGLRGRFNYLLPVDYLVMEGAND